MVQRLYLARAAAMHPDTAHHDKDDNETHVRTAALHHARDTLLHAPSRAEALLARLGGPAPHADKSLPEGFLMEIMETREAIEAVQTHDEHERWRAWARGQDTAYESLMERLFDRAEKAGGPARADTFREVRRTLNAWRYIQRLTERLDTA